VTSIAVLPIGLNRRNAGLWRSLAGFGCQDGMILRQARLDEVVRPSLRRPRKRCAFRRWILPPEFLDAPVRAPPRI
jgi:hypothetical protein